MIKPIIFTLRYHLSLFSQITEESHKRFYLTIQIESFREKEVQLFIYERHVSKAKKI
jgi:hypothetical protein